MPSPQKEHVSLYVWMQSNGSSSAETFSSRTYTIYTTAEHMLPKLIDACEWCVHAWKASAWENHPPAKLIVTCVSKYNHNFRRRCAATRAVLFLAIMLTVYFNLELLCSKTVAVPFKMTTHVRCIQIWFSSLWTPQSLYTYNLGYMTWQMVDLKRPLYHCHAVWVCWGVHRQIRLWFNSLRATASWSWRLCCPT